MDTNSAEKLCKDCKTKPVKPQRNAKRPFYRCEECHRAFKREEMRKSREKKKALLQDDPEKGMKRCSKCKKLKYYSAYSIRKNSVTNELNKICDACLTKAYLSKEKRAEGMSPEWWRARAYAANNTVRNRIARKLGVPTSSVPVKSLPWICGPNDLVELFNTQNGECCYCGVQITKDNLSVDHKTALGSGGTHTKENICLCCKDCNTLKLDKSSDQFTEFLQNYARRIISRYNL